MDLADIEVGHTYLVRTLRGAVPKVVVGKDEYNVFARGVGKGFEPVHTFSPLAFIERVLSEGTE
jgi:hypothetical protein